MVPARLKSWSIELLWLVMRIAIGLGFAIDLSVIAKAFQAAAMDRWHDRFSFDTTCGGAGNSVDTRRCDRAKVASSDSGFSAQTFMRQGPLTNEVSRGVVQLRHPTADDHDTGRTM